MPKRFGKGKKASSLNILDKLGNIRLLCVCDSIATRVPDLLVKFLTSLFFNVYVCAISTI